MKPLVAICLVVLFISILPSSVAESGSSNGQMLAVSIRSLKPLCGMKEKLSIEIQLENVGNESLLLWRSWAWGVGRTDVRVIDSNGKDVMTTFLADQLPPMPRREDFIELKPTEFFGIRLTEDATHFVNTPGTYDFVVEHTVPLTEQDIRKYVRLPDLPVWGRERGTIASNRIRIEISK
jgi:hypothetical protein